MGELINLNKARKARERTEAKARAGANRVTHGRSKSEKAASKIERDRTERLLDGSRRETPED